MNAGISAGATSITVAPIYKWVNGVKTKQGFDTTSGLALIRQGDKTERISFESSSVHATTKVTTLSSCTRGLSVTSTSTSFSAGTGSTWPKGARITVTHDASYIQGGVFTNVSNNFTVAQTITAPLTVTGSSSYVRVPSLTTAQRTALSGANGMIVYDSDLSQFYKFEAGAWAAVATGTFSNAANNTAGKVDLATAAEVAAGTANDATSGAPNVIPVSITTTSSAGAGDAGKVVALNASGLIPVPSGGTGVASTTAYAPLFGGTTSTGAFQSGTVGTAGQVLKSNGAAQLPTMQAEDVETRLCSVADSAAVGSASTAEADMATNYTIPANDLAAGVAYHISAAFVANIANTGGTDSLTIQLKLGSVDLLTMTSSRTDNLGNFIFDGWIVCRTAGATGTVKSHGFLVGEAANKCRGDLDTGTQTVDTTGTLLLQFSAQFSDSDVANACNVESMIASRHAAP